ncbi:MAG: phosphatase PAP2 family protein, partial [Gemmatimonadales bacterium]
VLHGAYFTYYLIIPLPIGWFAFTGRLDALRRTVLLVTTTFVVCYLAFLLYPVAGPYYEFPRPTGAFVDNPMARLVYDILGTGSSYGAAFPSSHVAATVTAAAAAWMGSRRLGIALAIPTALLIVGVVYCQMHYAVDAMAGVMVSGSVLYLYLSTSRPVGGYLVWR